MTFETFLAAAAPGVRPASAEAVLALAADGATLPFIARYRKERTGNLDEVGIQAVLDAKEKWDALLSRQAFVVAEIERQGKLTPELRERILATFDRDSLEDIYLPYKRKRQSRAAAAREAGLEPLADWIWACGHGTETPLPGQTLEIWAFTFQNEEKGFVGAEGAIRGATDILIERLAESLELRELVRREVREKGWLVSRRGLKAKPNSKFERYFDHRESIASLARPESSHRYMAIRRGGVEQELDVMIEGAVDDTRFEARLEEGFESAACTVHDSPGAEILRRAGRAALREHVFPAISTEIHKALKQVADDVAIDVFAANVRKLLLAAPYGSRPVLGVDPGIRTGCKLAVLDDAGGFVASGVLKLKSEEARAAAKAALVTLVTEHKIDAVAIGNGTAGREAESFARAALREAGSSVPVVMVSEAGASIYSASETAREEFPDLDVTVRGAVSIGRRLQDPLAELVKIDPKHIGVGQYQHDVPAHLLKRRLDQVVESCVNQVGVDLNTASQHLLTHVAGIGPGLAAALVEHRARNGLFRSRRQLFDVARFGAKAFEQAAGFLRIRGGEHPLDDTGVHPERYEALEAFAARHEKQIADLLGEGAAALESAAELRTDLGEYTFADVVAELRRPGRDPRDTFVPFEFRDDIHAIGDLQPGMICPGIVTNVTSFGAFVDIGVHQDGLVHVSQLSGRFVREARDVVSPGDRVRVRVLEANTEKGQISLSMKLGEAEDGARGGRERRGERRGPRPEQRGARGEARGAGTEARGPRPDPRGPRPEHGAGPRPGPRGPRVGVGAGPGFGGPAGRGGPPGRDRGGPGRDERRGERRGDRRDDRRQAPVAPVGARSEVERWGPGTGAGRGAGEPFNNPFAALLSKRDSFKPKP